MISFGKLRRGSITCFALVVVLTGAWRDGGNEAPAVPAGALIDCGGATFPPSVFDQPSRSLSSSSADRQVAPRSPTKEARWRVHESDDALVYVTGELPSPHLVALAKSGDDWAYRTNGDCTAFNHTDDEPAVWSVDPAKIGPDAATFEVWVSDRQCASGRPADERVSQARVVESANLVVVSFTASRLSGNQDCPSHPAATRTITLASPLGNRRMLDGALAPPQPPCRPGENANGPARSWCNAIFVPGATTPPFSGGPAQP